MHFPFIGLAEALKDAPEHLKAAAIEFAQVISDAVHFKATDVYIRRGAPLAFRASGETQFAIDWKVAAAKGCFDSELFDKIREWLARSPSSGSAPGQPCPTFTAVLTMSGTQIRVQYDAYQIPSQLLIRLQPREPYPLNTFFGEPATGIRSTLKAARGLMLVCGPLGSGKTSLMSSIVQFWASADGITHKGAQHIAMLGDPVEYPLSPDRYIVSRTDCALLEAAERPGVPYFSKVVPSLLRQDIDAVSVGEIREARLLHELLTFGGAKVIATFHAESIAECVIRVIGMAERCMAPETVRLLLASRFEGVFYVNIGFNSKDEAVPVVEYLPIASDQDLVRAIGGATPDKLITLIEERLKRPSIVGGLSYHDAVAAAQRRGLSEASVTELIGSLKKL